jgi:hypothetical protein
MAVVVGAGIIFAALRACPWLWESTLIAFAITVVAAVVAAVVVAAAEGGAAFVGAAIKAVADARARARPDRRSDD